MIRRYHRKVSLIILLVALFINWGCLEISAKAPTTTNTDTFTPINISRPTKTLTTDFSLTADFMETANLKDIVVTDIPTVTATTTPVPVGVFALLFYPPLIMNYDPLAWSDESHYSNRQYMTNGLQAKNLKTCTIGIQGPTDFERATPEYIQLGNVKYEVITFTDLQSGTVGAFYIEDHSLKGYNYEPGLPIPGVQASLSEWDECKVLAEKVLATLHFPSQ